MQDDPLTPTISNNNSREIVKIPKAELDTLKERILQLQQEVQKLRFQSLYVRDASHKNTSLIYGKPKAEKYICEECKKSKHQRSSTYSVNKLSTSPIHAKQQWSKWSKDFKIEDKQQQKMLQIDDQQPQSLPQSSPREDRVKEVNYEQKIQLRKKISLQKKPSSKYQNAPRLIESVCLFGPSQQAIFQSSEKIFTVPFQMYAPQNDFQQFSVYGNYIFPEEVNVKRIRQEKAATQINRVIFKKISQRQDTSVIILMGQQNHPLLEINYQNKLLQFCNPGKKLYAFSINFTDFLSYSSQEYKFNSTVFKNLINQPNGQQTSLDFNQTVSQGSGTGSITNIKQKKQNIFLSKFCITIFTYFPLVNLIEKLLLKIVEEIKIRRLQSFTQKQASTNQIDIKFIIRQLSIISQKLLKQTESFYPQLGNVGTLAIGQQMIQILLTKQQVHEQMYGGWAFSLMKPLTKDITFQILSHIILQESICFVCQDLYFLTFFILLFTDFLLRPLVYPYKHVSVMFDQDLLGAPIIVILGVNKKTSWLEYNLSLFSETKVIVNLNQQITVKCRKKKKIQKSLRMRKMLNFFFKWAQLGQGPFITKKRDPQLKQYSGQQNQIMLNFAKIFYDYLTQEIINHLPIPQIINPMKTHSGNNSNMCSSILKAVQKYFNQSRKHKQKDQFIDLISKHQIFYLLVGTKYGIM